MPNKHLFNYMKNCLFVGSFNPITMAHENISKDLLKDKIIDYLYFLPVNSNKKDLITIDKRINMINLIKNNQEEVLNIYNYSNDGLFNYNILNSINNNIKITHILMGSDLFLKFNTFKNYQDILNNYTLIIINRNDNIADYINNNYKDYKDKIILINKEYKGSSYLAKQELLENKNNYLNNKVLNYIKDNNLYN